MPFQNLQGRCGHQQQTVHTLRQTIRTPFRPIPPAAPPPTARIPRTALEALPDVCYPLPNAGRTLPTTMPARRKKSRPGERLKRGAFVLSAAGVVDTTTVTTSLRRFKQAHRSYAAAHRKVTAVQSTLRAGYRRVTHLRALRDDAVESFARALAAEGHSLAKPFRAFGAPTLSQLARLAIPDAAKIIDKMAKAVIRREGGRPQTAKAAQSALDAVRSLQEGLDAVAKIQEDLRMACLNRDAFEGGWDGAIRALRLAAIAAQDDGAPELHPALFPPLRPRRGRKKA